MRAPWPLVLLLTGCPADNARLGELVVDLDRDGGTLTITSETYGSVLEELRFLAGSGDAAVETQFGSWRFTGLTDDVRGAVGFDRLLGRRGPTAVIEVVDAAGSRLGEVSMSGPSTPRRARPAGRERRAEASSTAPWRSVV